MAFLINNYWLLSKGHWSTEARRARPAIEPSSVLPAKPFFGTPLAQSQLCPHTYATTEATDSFTEPLKSGSKSLPTQLTENNLFQVQPPVTTNSCGCSQPLRGARGIGVLRVDSAGTSQTRPVRLQAAAPTCLLF